MSETASTDEQPLADRLVEIGVTEEHAPDLATAFRSDDVEAFLTTLETELSEHDFTWA